MERSPHPERSRRIWSQSRRVPPVLFTTATLTSRRRDDSLRARQLLQRVGEGRKRRSALLRQAINAISLALEPAIEIVQENLADIGHQPGGAQHRDLRRAVAREELGAAQRLLAVGGDDGNASHPSPAVIAAAPRSLAVRPVGLFPLALLIVLNTSPRRNRPAGLRSRNIAAAAIRQYILAPPQRDS